MTATDERAAFTRAILAEPAEDTHRLVYADWLQENGDEPRAEFIRAQLELARNPCGDLPRTQQHAPSPTNGPCAGCVRVSAKRRELHDAFDLDRQLKWFALPRGLMIPPGGVRRGFVTEVACTAADWLAHADTLLAQHPIERVRLTTWPKVYVIQSGMYVTGRKFDGRTRVHPAGSTHTMLEAEWPGISITFELPDGGMPVPPHLTATNLRDVLAAELTRRMAESQASQFAAPPTG